MRGAACAGFFAASAVILARLVEAWFGSFWLFDLWIVLGVRFREDDVVCETYPVLLCGTL